MSRGAPGVPTTPGVRFFVHRYRWSHDKRRQQVKALLKQGRVRLVSLERDGKLYEVVELKEDFCGKQHDQQPEIAERP